MSFEIKWDRTPQQIADRIFDDATMTFIHTRLQAYCSDYVPMDSGMLDDTVDVTSEYVHYKQPYAHFQWEGIVFVDDRGSAYAKQNHSKHPTGTPLKYNRNPDGTPRQSVHHPLATSHWEVAAMAAHKGDLCQDITNYLKRK